MKTLVHSPLLIQRGSMVLILSFLRMLIHKVSHTLSARGRTDPALFHFNYISVTAYSLLSRLHKALYSWRRSYSLHMLRFFQFPKPFLERQMNMTLFFQLAFNFILLISIIFSRQHCTKRKAPNQSLFATSFQKPPSLFWSTSFSTSESV